MSDVVPWIILQNSNRNTEQPLCPPNQQIAEFDYTIRMSDHFNYKLQKNKTENKPALCSMEEYQTLWLFLQYIFKYCEAMWYRLFVCLFKQSSWSVLLSWECVYYYLKFSIKKGWGVKKKKTSSRSLSGIFLQMKELSLPWCTQECWVVGLNSVLNKTYQLDGHESFFFFF